MRNQEMDKKEFNPGITSSIIAMIIMAVVDILLIAFFKWALLPPFTIRSAALPSVAMLLGFADIIILLIISNCTDTDMKILLVISVAVEVISLAVMLIGAINSSTAFHAVKYSKVIKVENSTKDDIPSSTDMKKLFLTDTASAKKLCQRVLGSNPDWASQYDVGDLTQIVYKRESVKTAPLVYNGFWKWNSHKEQGIPAYIIVRNDEDGKPYAKVITLDKGKGMKYVPSAAFDQKLSRHIYEKYNSYIFESSHFEIDEKGNPFYVTPYVTHTIGIYGGKKITGAIVTDPCTGKMKDYKLKDIPSWVDLVIDGDTIAEQYDWYGELRGGFWNSVIGQKGCVHTTDDFGYVSDGTDIWIFTGITSVTSEDSSNQGFVLANERTGELKYIKCDGADEKSAMNAAEGEVQEKKYTASFPSLITLDGEPTYIMVLKDKNMLTKDYACVNVQRYDQIAVAATPEQCFDVYRKLIKGEISQQEAVNSDEPTQTESTEPENTDRTGYKVKLVYMQKVADIVIDGTTYVYIMDEKGNMYRSKDPKDILTLTSFKTVSGYIHIYTDGKTFTTDIPKGYDCNENLHKDSKSSDDTAKAKTKSNN